jgi:3-oxoadipate enol-lactonase
MMPAPDVAAEPTERLGPAPRLALDWAGSGPLVVFLHGIGGNRSNWAEQIAHFSDRYTAVAWDARGWGQSDDYEGPLRFEDMVADLCRVLDRFGAARAHLVGLSMGARICLDAWKRAPERVASLTLAAASAGMHEDVGLEARQKFLDDRRRPLVEGGSTADMADRLAPRLVAQDAPAEVCARAHASLAALRKESYLRALETVTWYTDFPPFESITVPTLVISGTEDYLAPPPISEAMAARIPGARRVLIEDCGHLCNFEKPAEFNAALDSFLAQAGVPA